MVTLAAAGRYLGNRFLPALEYRDFRRLWGATLFSQSSAWGLIVARGALALTLTGSPFGVAIVTYAGMIPSVVASPIAGYLADRFDRRTVLAWAYAFNTLQNLVLAVLVVTGAIELWHLIVLSLINGSFRAVQATATAALLANTVPRERLFNAVALHQTTFNGSRFLGPFLILVLLWVTGRDDWAFVLCTGLYTVGFGLVLTIRTASRGVVEAGGGVRAAFDNVTAGLRYMYRHPLILSVILLVVAHCCLTMSFDSLFPVLSRDKLGMESGAGFLVGFGYMMSAFGAGALLVAIGLAGVQNERVRGRMFLWLGVMSGLTPLALGMSPNLPLAALSAAAMGASQGGFMTLTAGMIQLLAPDAIRGRLMSVYTWHILTFMSTFNLINGTLAEVTTLTASVILAAGGIAFLMVVGGSFARVPLRQLYGQGVPAEARAA